MKRKIFFAAFAAACLFVITVFCAALPVCAQQPDPSQKFQEYRSAIQNAHGIDIKDFTDTTKGGRADGKAITKYDLQQLIMGVTVEQEHTTDKFKALEISMDHLEEFPDYYTRLHHMEEDAEKEKEQKKGK